MADILTFNDELGLIGLTGTTLLSGSIDVVYGNTPSVTGTLTIAAFGTFSAQLFSNIVVTQTGFSGAGVPIYLLTGSNGVTNLSINYTGAAPATVTVNLSNTINAPLAGLANAPILPCFAQGTKIRTNRGEVAVEDLKVGDKVITASGKRRAIRWLGSSTVDCLSHPEPRAVLPIRIAAGAFAPYVPSEDLLLSPGHGICVQVLDEVLMPAGLLVNGSTVRQIEVDQITYWHVELESHDIIFSNGMRSESYIDVGNRAFFAGAPDARPDALADAATLEHYCRPYIADESVARIVRQRLQARAVALGWTLDDSPLADLHLDVDGRTLPPEVDGLTARFVVPAGASEVWLKSDVSVPAALFDSADMRQLGVCLRAISVDGLRLAADDPVFCVGVHPAEGEGPTRCRWTVGRALLPQSLWDHHEVTSLAVELAGPALPRWAAPTTPPLRAAA